ncbi:SPFH domain-containing protein [Streptomyces sp. NPDC047434]|uniref:SPFH domain-containing protein n=1 Tax=Streptomyces sp. NPDC047434 TaxID=3155143 RepID=UPI0033E32C58
MAGPDGSASGPGGVPAADRERTARAAATTAAGTPPGADRPTGSTTPATPTAPADSRQPAAGRADDGPAPAVPPAAPAVAKAPTGAVADAAARPATPPSDAASTPVSGRERPAAGEGAATPAEKPAAAPDRPLTGSRAAAPPLSGRAPASPGSTDPAPAGTPATSSAPARPGTPAEAPASSTPGAPAAALAVSSPTDHVRDVTAETARTAADAVAAKADTATGPSAPATPSADRSGTTPSTPSTPSTPTATSGDRSGGPRTGSREDAASGHVTCGRREFIRVSDIGRIIDAPGGVIAVPVAAEQAKAPAPAPVRTGPRRKNVIGTETTGSIPVHLLFRDEPDPSAASVGVADDGGPATVAMATLAPSPVPASAAPPASAFRARIPKPARARSARPAPPADPGLVERPGPALPGWIGVAAGFLALAGCAAVVWWAGAVPDALGRMLRLPVRPYQGIHLGQWALLALGVLATLFTFGGLGRGRVGHAYVLTLFGDYRGTVRRTGLLWISPLLLRRRVDVRLRHWRSEPLSAVDAKGTALDVVVLVVWRIRDTVRAALGVDGHEAYLREQVEAAMARVLSQLPADAFHEDAPTLRDAEAVGEALTRMLSAECAPVGVDVFSAQPTRIEYAPEIAAAMQRRRIAAIDAKHRDSVLTAVVDAVDDVVHRLTARGLVELDDYERKALVKDLTVAFYTGRTAPGDGA